MLSSSFEHLLYFLYTDQAPHVQHTDCLGVIELANRYFYVTPESIPSPQVLPKLDQLENTFFSSSGLCYLAS